jgi:peptidoglycan hydrolase-like protein with peptidoglycan-binding domain
MTKLLQIGHSTAAQIDADYGHMAFTLGGVNYESRGSRGVLKGSSARGADHPLFRQHHYIVLGDAQAKEAKKAVDKCVGQPYKLGLIPSATHGGDCSGYACLCICVAKGMTVRRLFTTATWLNVADGLGFKKGLKGKIEKLIPGDPGAMDRPFPGIIIRQGSTAASHVRWIKARLNFAAHNKHPELDGDALSGSADFGPRTFKVVKGFQRRHHLEDDGEVGKNTWAALNKVR